MRDFAALLRAKYSNVDLRYWLDACKKLKLYYAKKQSVFTCPLCFVLDTRSLSCEDCVWLIFKGKRCTQFAPKWSEKNGFSDYGITSLKHVQEWRDYRIKEIDKWMKYIRKALDMKR